MGYYVPTGFSRVTLEHNSLAPSGSKPVWGFGCALDPSIENALVIQEWWDDNMRNLTNEEVTLERIVMRNNTSVTEFPVGHAGTASATFQPPQVCALAKLTTGFPGRAFRGRFYIPNVLSDGDVDEGGQIASLKLGALEDALSALFLATDVAGGALVILHTFEGTAVEPTFVTGGQMQSLVATQRRRLRR